MLLILIEFGLSLLAIVLALSVPRLGDRWFSAVEYRISRFAGHRRLAVATIFFLSLGARVAVLPIEPIPHPGVHDEFSHLLLGDTLAHGRLANPTPPMWVHFETFHENFVPAYASMYYPGQGAFLALGQVIFGHPFWGVWLSTALMCAAFCWALQAWMPPGWAFLGAILAIIRIGTFSYWNNSYWGGSVAGLGGALVIGALPRIAECQRVRDALLMAIGFVVIANTRPFEGLFLCLPIAIGLLAFLFFRVRPRSAWIKTVLLPASAVIVIMLGLMALYFYRTTGSPFTIPYKINMQRYGYVYFPWQHFDTAIHFNHEPMKVFYDQELLGAAEHSRSQVLSLFMFRALNMWSFFCGPALTTPLWFLLFALPSNLRAQALGWRIWLLLAALLLAVISLFLPSLFLNTHYAGPITPAFYVILLLAFMRLYSWAPWKRPVGKALVRAVPICAFVLLGIYVLVPSLRPPSTVLIPTWCTAWHPLDRTAVEQQLNRIAGQHLVIVHYSPTHDAMREWVFNQADFSGSKILWARDMGWAENQQIIKFYRNRKVWLLEPDLDTRKLMPYPETIAAAELRSP